MPTSQESEAQSRLSMSREQMLDLANQATKILVDQILSEADGAAWDGEFRDVIAERLDKVPPEEGRDIQEVLTQVTDEVFNFQLNLAHPKCLGFVPSSPTWPGVIADFLTAGFNPNVCTWLVASGPSQIELTVTNWFKDWLGYPDTAGGFLSSGSSQASVEAFAVARELAGNPARPTIYMSDQTHQSLVRAARVVGVGFDHIRKCATDANFAIDVAKLADTVAEDVQQGYQPIIVVANAGTTSTGTIDPLEAIADFCESQNIWFHVDAAYGGFACVTEQGHKLLRGIERSDSITLDPHKWFFQPYEAGCLMVKDLSTLERFYGMKSDVLQDTVWGSNHPNLTNRGIQLSRSFRALKLWMSVQIFGMNAFMETVEQGMRLARQTEQYIENCPHLELLNPVVLSVVCFRYNPVDAKLDETAVENINRTILTRLFWDNHAFLSSTALRGTFALRVCILNHTTQWNDLLETLEAVETFGYEAMEGNLFQSNN